MACFFERKPGIKKDEIKSLVIKSATECLNRIYSAPRKVLLLPTDITRAHSGAGCKNSDNMVTFRFIRILVPAMLILISVAPGAGLI